jgi:hypothetical protein
MDHSNRAAVYQIRVEGHVHERWFEGLDVFQTAAGETVIRGAFDQAALHGLLTRVRDLALELISVQRIPQEERNSE